MKKSKVLPILITALCTAVITFSVTFFVMNLLNRPRKAAVLPTGEISYTDKLREVQNVIDAYFIGEIDNKTMGDALAAGMISGLGDEWSYYIPKESYEAYQESVKNAYVGIGVTITTEGADRGLLITDVTPDSPAAVAGIQPGDVILAVNGQAVLDGSEDCLDLESAKQKVRGKEGTKVELTLLRDGRETALTLTRKSIKVVNVTSAMMDDTSIMYIRIRNFDENAAQDTVSAIEDALSKGATGLIFDVRNNPGGLKRELVALLDYILPEGPLFRSVDYNGKESVDQSDASHIEIPMAVLVNHNSYSAAEFFAAALQEYDYADIVGEQTYGKGYFQSAFQLSDGSAVNISVGKYTTPKNNSLVGKGITPDQVVPLTEEEKQALSLSRLAPEEDPQLQQAIGLLDPGYSPRASAPSSGEEGEAGVTEGSAASYYKKLDEIRGFIDRYYIGEVDEKAMADALAEGMINALGDEWSYYIPQESYQSYVESVTNSYVGIGVTITIEGVDRGLLITDVTPESPAYHAGLQIGDVMTAVEGTPIRDGTDDSLDLTETKNLVRGEEGTDVTITVEREGKPREYTITRRSIKVVNVTSQMLEDGVAYIKIRNFEENAASDAKAAVASAMGQGAKSIVFDVRYNPGGLKRELVELLDYLLPEGPLFRSVDYAGREQVDTSDAAHIELPMAVLVNYDSYSAAEFFAAALQEYGAAAVVGEKTYGKGRFQTSFLLSDGSAINISIGQYTTPNGVSLVGKGIEPDHAVPLSEEEKLDLYYGRLKPEDDEQLKTAISVLNP